MSTPTPSTPSGPSSQPTRVKARRGPRKQLTGRQQQALEQLAAGQSICAAAAVVGVDRRTVHRWLSEDPRFRAAYNAWQQEQIDSCRAQLLTMLGDAAATVSKSIKKGDARIAMGLLKQFEVAAPAPPSSSDPDLLRHAQAIAHEEQRHELDRRAKALGRDDLSPIENEERRNILENPTREYIDMLRDWCDLAERDLDRAEGKPPKPLPPPYARPVRDPQTGEVIYDSAQYARDTGKPQPPSASQPQPQTHVPQSNPPAPGAASGPAAHATPTSPAPPARNVARATDEPEPLDPTGPVVAYNDPNTIFLEGP